LKPPSAGHRQEEEGEAEKTPACPDPERPAGEVGKPRVAEKAIHRVCIKILKGKSMIWMIT
jgi:hypothetical protein